MAVALKGDRFLNRWAGQSAASLMSAVRRMPPMAPVSLDAPVYASIMAYLLAENGVPAGNRELPTDATALTAMTIPRGADGSRTAAGGRAPSVSTGLFARGPSRLDTLTPVTADLLRTPPPGDWLLWRRTYDSVGFSPLTSITRDNVNDLRVQWSWALPPGTNMRLIVHDGVDLHSFGDSRSDRRHDGSICGAIDARLRTWLRLRKKGGVTPATG
jgi:alcohol dehydrogenase (cytochrome c)